VDQAEMRRANMSLILQHLRTHGGRSRANIARETGLSKASLSNLVTELADRGLVRERAPERGGSVGRPSLQLDLDGRYVAGLGVEINDEYIAATAVDLSGAVIREAAAPLHAVGMSSGEALDQIAGMTRRVADSLKQAGCLLVAMTVSAPGVIDYEHGAIRFAPNLGWRGVPLIGELRARLGPDFPEIRLENDAKLSALAEHVQGHEHDGVQDLLFLAGHVGVGAGIVAGGQLLRGWSGYSGEVGHLPLDPSGRPCACGRTGCWEGIVGLNALLELAADEGDPVRDEARPLDHRLVVLRERAMAGDQRTLEALATITRDLATGVSLLLDVLNPRVVVLGGYYAYFGDLLVEPLRRALDERSMDARGRALVVASSLGLTAASRGGALLAIADVFADPLVVPVLAAGEARRG
jgi:predicted NBD/HSP70 family sugar kinase